MKTEIAIPDHFPALKEEDLIAANVRREKYSQLRDLQATEFNGAIASRLLKDKEMQESVQRADTTQIKCVKCGKKFSVGITEEDTKKCPECK